MLDPVPGRPEAASAIWEQGERAPGAEPSPGRARGRGVAQGLLAAAIGAAVLWLWSPVGAIVIGLGALVVLAALASPLGLYAAIERALAALGRAVGAGLTWLLMAGIFYLVFLPFGLLFRRGRRDALRRFYEPDAASYWEPRVRGRTASASRARQY